MEIKGEWSLWRLMENGVYVECSLWRLMVNGVYGG